MSFVSFSQTIKKDSVTLAKRTLKSIVKESRKCDSVKVAFRKKSILLQGLIKHNLSIFSDLEKEKSKREQLQLQLQKTNKDLLNLSKRKRNVWLYGTGGVAVGVIITLLVSK
jgi:hypothetical protein